MVECFNCGRDEQNRKLVKVRSREENEDKREFDDKGRIIPTYETKKRWWCLNCLGVEN